MAMSRTLALCLIFSMMLACSTISWRYYGISLPVACYGEGTLLGPKPANDLPLSVCQPDATIKGKCAVMLQDEFFRLMTDDAQCQAALKSCQQNGR